MRRFWQEMTTEEFRALDTVRARWRFVPAQRDGVGVESWCEVPIRFALTEAQTD